MSTEQFTELKHDLREIKDDLGEIKTTAELLKNEKSHMDEAIKRAFRRIEQVEKEIKEITQAQNKNAWVPILVTAIVTSVMVGGVAKLVELL